MSNSSLVSKTIYSPNHSGKRKYPINRITPHCVVGQCTIDSLGEWFKKSSTQASSNYGIDKDGQIGLFVDENNRSWCSSSPDNDNRAVTIECASDTNYPLYKMNDAVYLSLIRLCVDICKRNGKDKLIWIKDKNTALSYQPKDNEMLLTVHKWFHSGKTCPGDWLYERLEDLAVSVTAILSSEKKEEEEVTQEQFNNMMNVWLEQQTNRNASNWSSEARDWAEKNGYVQGDEKGRKMYKKFMTREELVTVLYRILHK